MDISPRSTTATLLTVGGAGASTGTGYLILTKLLDTMDKGNVVPIFVTAITGVVLIFALVLMSVGAGFALLRQPRVEEASGGPVMLGTRQLPVIVLVSGLALAGAGLLTLAIVVLSTGVQQGGVGA